MESRGVRKETFQNFPNVSRALRCCQPKLQQEIVKMGKVKYVGVSEFSPAWTRAMHAIHPVTAMQIEWSLVTRKLVSGSLVSVSSLLKKMRLEPGIVLKV